jgi:uncharacterized protein (UPF0264 family)
MRLFVSARGVEEAMVCTAVSDQVDMVDVENPREGPLGAPPPWVVRAVREMTPRGKQVSATVGGAPFRPGAAALAALGAAASGADQVRVGLFGTATPDQAVELVRGVVRAVKEHDPALTVVALGYADARRIGSVNPLSVPYVAHESGADGAMLDTAVKGGPGLFDLLEPSLCGEFAAAAHGFGLTAVLAGGLTAADAPDLAATGADALAVRGAVCAGGDRESGALRGESVTALRQALDAQQGGSPYPSGLPLAGGAALS